jgi:PAS domain S-box-containing protein
LTGEPATNDDRGGGPGRDGARPARSPVERELELYRELVDNAGEGIYRLDFDPPVDTRATVDEQVVAMLAAGRVGTANDAQARMYGYERGAEIVGLPVTSWLLPDVPENRASLAAFVTGGYRYHDVESFEHDRQGRPRRFLNSAIGVIEGDLLVAAWGSQRDVTVEREVLEKLRESERKFALAFRANPGALVISRLRDGVFLDVNDAFAELVGLERDQLIGRSSLELGLWPDPEERMRVFGPMVERGSARRVPARVVAASGEAREARISGLRVEIEGETCLLVLAEDVTELNRAERRLATSEQRFRKALDGSADAFFLLEAVRDDRGAVIDFRMADANAAAGRLTGQEREAILGGSMVQRCPVHRDRSLFERYRGVLERGRLEEEEFEVQGRNGRRLWLRQQVVPLAEGVAIWARNVTDRRAAEAERRREQEALAQTQRLDSLGLLAGGVAHDFNNLLTAMLGNAEMARRRLPPGSPAAVPLADIEVAARRAAELTQKMLAFAGGGALQFTWISLNEVVSEMVDLLRPALRGGREVALALARPSPGLEADPTQMRQVVLNLVLNAAEAIEGEGGRIEVATGEVYCERDRLAAAVIGADRPEGRYVFLRVSDDGAGLSPELRERIFEPFFTTKFTGRGLGLAAVLGIVRGHHGVIEVESAEGRGTTFTLLLPLSQPRLEPR